MVQVQRINGKLVRSPSAAKTPLQQQLAQRRVNIEQARVQQQQVQSEAQRIDQVFVENNYGGSVEEFTRQYNSIKSQNPEVANSLKVNPGNIQQILNQRISELQRLKDKSNESESKFRRKAREEKSSFKKGKIKAKAEGEKAFQQGIDQGISQLRNGEFLTIGQVKKFANQLEKATEEGVKLKLGKQKVETLKPKTQTVKVITNPKVFFESQGKKYLNANASQRKKIINDLNRDYGSNVSAAVAESATFQAEVKDLDKADFSKVFDKLIDKQGNIKKNIIVDKPTLDKAYKVTINQESQRFNLPKINLNKNVNEFNKRSIQIKELKTQAKRKQQEDIFKSRSNLIKGFKLKDSTRQKLITGQNLNANEKREFYSQAGKNFIKFTNQKANKFLYETLLKNPFEYGRSLSARAQAGGNPLKEDFQKVKRNVSKRDANKILIGGLKETGDIINFFLGVKGITINSKGETFDGIIASGVRPLIQYGIDITKAYQQGTSKNKLKQDLKGLVKTSKFVGEKTVDVGKFILDKPVGAAVVVGYGINQGIISGKSSFLKNTDENIGRTLVALFPGLLIKGVTTTAKVSKAAAQKSIQLTNNAIEQSKPILAQLNKNFIQVKNKIKKQESETQKLIKELKKTSKKDNAYKRLKDKIDTLVADLKTQKSVNKFQKQQQQEIKQTIKKFKKQLKQARRKKDFQKITDLRKEKLNYLDSVKQSIKFNTIRLTKKVKKKITKKTKIKKPQTGKKIGLVEKGFILIKDIQKELAKRKIIKQNNIDVKRKIKNTQKEIKQKQEQLKKLNKGTPKYKQILKEIEFRLFQIKQQRQINKTLKQISGDEKKEFNKTLKQLTKIGKSLKGKKIIPKNINDLLNKLIDKLQNLISDIKTNRNLKKFIKEQKKKEQTKRKEIAKEIKELAKGEKKLQKKVEKKQKAADKKSLKEFNSKKNKLNNNNKQVQIQLKKKEQTKQVKKPLTIKDVKRITLDDSLTTIEKNTGEILRTKGAVQQELVQTQIPIWNKQFKQINKILNEPLIVLDTKKRSIQIASRLKNKLKNLQQNSRLAKNVKNVSKLKNLIKGFETLQKKIQDKDTFKTFSSEFKKAQRKIEEQKREAKRDTLFKQSQRRIGKRVQKQQPKTKLIKVKKIKGVPKKPRKLPRFNFDSSRLNNKILVVEGQYRERKDLRKPANKRTNPVITKTIKLRDTKNRILNSLAKLADNKLVRSIQVQVIDITDKKKKDVKQSKVLNKFNKKKSKNTPVLRLVEKTKNIADTRGEKRELKQSKRIKKKK